MPSEAKCYLHGVASVCPCDPVYATASEAKDAEIARLREALEWYAESSRYRMNITQAFSVPITVETGEANRDAGARARRALEGKDAD